MSFILNASTGGVNVLSSGGLNAGSVHTGSTIASVLSSGGLLAGSFHTGSTIASVLSSGGLSLLSAFSQTTTVSAVVSTGTTSWNLNSSLLPSFAYNGTFGMTTNTTQASYLSGPFMQGIMATGGSAASIDLRSTAVTVTGSVALQQPWFALAGA